MKGMLRIVGLSVFLISLFQCSQSGEGVKIYGTAESLSNGAFVRIERIGDSGSVAVDTTQIIEGAFETYIVIDEPAFYSVNFNDRQNVSLILTGDEDEVVIHADGNDPQGFSEISGSYDTEYKNQMDELLKSYREEATIIQGKLRQAQASNDREAYMQANNELMTYSRRIEKQLKEMVWEATPSLAAIYGIQMLDQEKNITLLDSVYQEMNKEIPENYLVANLGNVINSRKRLGIGQEAPEIALANPDGEIVRLSSLRGKYVLIDFWAAWCRPCRMENPNVVRMYNEYSDENFEIYGVSLDKTKAAWLKAIEQDGVPWIHVSDLKFWQSEAAKLYNVSAIPATFLIDPEGKIIAKNLRGPSLEAKLKEIFG